MCLVNMGKNVRTELTPMVVEVLGFKSEMSPQAHFSGLGFWLLSI